MDVASERYYVKSLWNQIEKLRIRDGILVKKQENSDNKDVSYQVVVSSKERRKVLTFVPDLKTLVHLGFKKTLTKIR